MTDNLTITRGSGFQLTFDNGCTISVQFGSGNYHDKRDTYPVTSDRSTTLKVLTDGVTWESNFWHNDVAIAAIGTPNAEIAVWNRDWTGGSGRGGDWIHWGSDSVRGWVSATEIGKIIGVLSNLPAGVTYGGAMDALAPFEAAAKPNYDDDDDDGCAADTFDEDGDCADVVSFNPDTMNVRFFNLELD